MKSCPHCKSTSIGYWLQDYDDDMGLKLVAYCWKCDIWIEHITVPERDLTEEQYEVLKDIFMSKVDK